MRKPNNSKCSQMSLFSSCNGSLVPKKQHVNVLFSSAPKSVALLMPVELILDEHKFKVNCWQDVLRMSCEYILKAKPLCLRHRLMDPEFLWIDRREGVLSTPVELAPYLWVDLGGSNDDLFLRTTQLLGKCGALVYGARVKCREGQTIGGCETDNSSDLINRWERQSNGAIGKFARMALTHLLENHLLNESQISTLSTAQGTYRELGIYLKKCPLISSREFVDAAGFVRCWRSPIVVGTNKFYVNKEWYESSRKRLVAWLRHVLKQGAKCSTSNAPLIVEWEKQSKGKIGKFAFLALRYIVENCLLSKDEFETLCTAAGVKRILGISLTHSPLFGLREIVDSNGYRRSWTECAVALGRSVYINQQWYETSRKHLLKWLNAILERNEHFDDMLVKRDDGTEQRTINKVETEDTADDEFERQLDQWGKESL